MIQSSPSRPGPLHRKSDAPQTDLLIIFLVWAAGLGAAAQFGKIAVALGAFRAAYPVSEVALGFLISCVGMVGLIFGVLGGILITRIGIRRAFVIGMLAAAALSALQAFMLPYPVMIALRVLEGASHLAIVIAGPILMARHSSDAARPAVMTLWSSFFGLSFMLIALIAPALLSWGGAEGLLLAHAAYMAALGLALWRVLPAPAAQGAAAHLPLSLGDILGLHGQIYRSAYLSAAALGFVWYTGLYIALLTYLPGFVAESHRTGLSASLPLASIITSLTLGVLLLRYIPAVRAVQIGFLITALFALPLLWTLGWDAGFILVCLALMGATGLIPGASFSALAVLNPDEQNRAYATGAIAQMGNVGTTTGPPILAAIVSAAGISGTVAFVLIYCAAGIAIHQWLAARRRLTPQ